MVIKFTEKYLDITISPKTRNTIYQYIGNDTSISLNFYFWNGDIPNIPPNSHGWVTKKGKDLILTTLFLDKKRLTPKYVKTTIKNFYEQESVYKQIWFYCADSYSCTDDFTITPGMNLATEAVFVNAGFSDVPDKHYYFASDDKDANFTLSQAEDVVVIDFKGNDNYTILREYYNNNTGDYDNKGNVIHDFAGNDKYYCNNNNRTRVEDFKGKDEYEVSGTTTYKNSNLRVQDYASNDKYNANNCGILYIDDFKGNDTYVASNGGYLDVSDEAGNDIYEITNNSGSFLGDLVGNDKYSFLNSQGDINAHKDIVVEDYAGNDKYTFYNTKIAFDGSQGQINETKGNDNYNISNSAGFWFYDYAGNDKYIVSDCSLTNDYTVEEQYDRRKDLRFSDFSGNDTYEFSNIIYSVLDTNNCNILDSSGNDKYNIDSVVNLAIKDNGIGKDTYNIKNSNNVYIEDSNGNDTYKLDRIDGVIKINDATGKDSLIINCDQCNFIYMTNINKINNGDNQDGSLLIYDKINGGYVAIKNFFGVDLTKNYTARGAGEIESIKIKKKVNGQIFTEAMNVYNEIRSDIASWLENKNYADVSDCLLSNNIDDINILVSAYTNHNVAELL